MIARQAGRQNDRQTETEKIEIVCAYMSWAEYYECNYLKERQRKKQKCVGWG